MISIHTILIGQAQTLTDDHGTWTSAIVRRPVSGPIMLTHRGLDGDAVADTEHHGSPDQAVCCHALAHYAYWNDVYALKGAGVVLGPGSVGENWTIAGAIEADLCVGDVFRVGDAVVQISAPRYPCSKQERKLGLPAFLRRTLETLRTGWYMRVVTPGMVCAHDVCVLEQRPYPDLTIQWLNEGVHRQFMPDVAQRLLDLPEVGSAWKRVLSLKLTKQI